ALAKALGLPVVVVVDAGGAVRSAAAVVRGFRDFDPALRLAGVVFNRVGGAAHLADLAAAAAPLGVPLLGGLPWEPSATVPERHLGLVTAAETPWTPSACAVWPLSRGIRSPSCACWRRARCGSRPRSRPSPRRSRRACAW